MRPFFLFYFLKLRKITCQRKKKGSSRKKKHISLLCLFVFLVSKATKKTRACPHSTLHCRSRSHCIPFLCLDVEEDRHRHPRRRYPVVHSLLSSPPPPHRRRLRRRRHHRRRASPATLAHGPPRQPRRGSRCSTRSRPSTTWCVSIHRWARKRQY